ncbi:hypothetical protein C8Q78DRAFT_1020339 [Trametes maxima]|nr:hypothetical protein C8Q78DRAFT_1020339 [Trametes maxima]
MASLRQTLPHSVPTSARNPTRGDGTTFYTACDGVYEPPSHNTPHLRGQIPSIPTRFGQHPHHTLPHFEEELANNYLAGQPTTSHVHQDNAFSAVQWQAHSALADPTSAIPPPSHYASALAHAVYSGGSHTQWLSDAFETSCTIAADRPRRSTLSSSVVRHSSTYSTLSGALGDHPQTMLPRSPVLPTTAGSTRLDSATPTPHHGGSNPRGPSSPSSPSSRPSAEFISSTRRNAFVPSTAAATTTPPDSANRWRCPYCPYVQRVHRSPDLARHIATHTRPADPAEALWVCCGVPVSSPAAVVAGLRDAKPFVYEGMRMVGGCRKTFSRRDALKRHLKNNEGICFGDEFAPYLPGNRDGTW